MHFLKLVTVGERNHGYGDDDDDNVIILTCDSWDCSDCLSLSVAFRRSSNCRMLSCKMYQQLFYESCLSDISG